jgi:hypothetical protein
VNSLGSARPQYSTHCHYVILFWNDEQTVEAVLCRVIPDGNINSVEYEAIREYCMSEHKNSLELECMGVKRNPHPSKKHLELLVKNSKEMRVSPMFFDPVI